jgi:hypothetical protein
MSRTCPSWPRPRLSRWPKPPSGCGSCTGAAFRWVRTLLGLTAEVVTPCRPEGQVRVQGSSGEPAPDMGRRGRRSLVLSPQRLGCFPTEASDLLLELSEPLPAPLDQLFSALPVGPFSGRLANRADLDIPITRPRGTAGAGTRPPGQVAKIPPPRFGAPAPPTGSPPGATGGNSSATSPEAAAARCSECSRSRSRSSSCSSSLRSRSAARTDVRPPPAPDAGPTTSNESGSSEFADWTRPRAAGACSGHIDRRNRCRIRPSTRGLDVRARSGRFRRRSSQFEDADLHLAGTRKTRLGGFEPPTRGLEVRRSVH